MDGTYKLYIVDGFYDRNDEKYTFYSATGGYTLIFSDKKPCDGAFEAENDRIFDEYEKKWLNECRIKTAKEEFKNFADSFFDNLFDLFEKELETERQKAENEEKGKRKWLKRKKDKKKRRHTAD